MKKQQKNCPVEKKKKGKEEGRMCVRGQEEGQWKKEKRKEEGRKKQGNKQRKKEGNKETSKQRNKTNER